MSATEPLEQTFQKAVRFYESGNLKKALKCLTDIQRKQPGIPDVLHLLGLVTLRLDKPKDAAKYLETAARLVPQSPEILGLFGSALRKANRPEDAVRAFEQALKINPNAADLHFNLGNTLKDLGLLEDASASYRKAVGIEPGFMDAWVNLGQGLKALENFSDAADALREALRLDPADIEARMTLGNTLDQMGDRDAALRELETVLEAAPEMAAAHYNLANVLTRAGKSGEAVDLYREALELEPGRAETHNNLGEAILELGEIENALDHYRQALEIDPNLAEAHNNLGNALARLGDMDAAKASYDRALEINPSYAAAHTNLGNLMADLARWDEAEACYRNAVACDPERPELHHNLSLLLLLRDRMEEGWAEYEWRWRSRNGANRRDFPQRPWQGEDLAGKTIMVWSEQGVGDEILFAGMVPALLQAAARVIVECDARLVPVFERSFPGATCVPRANSPDPRLLDKSIDYQCAAGSLGRWLRPAADIHTGAYLTADAAHRERLRQRYKGDGDNRLIGVTWNSKNVSIGDKKSLPLSELIPLAGIPGVTLVDLQYGDTLAQRDAFAKETGVDILHDDGIDQMADLDAFCAQVAAMDVVVTVSNTTAHFAGALGLPTWVMVHSAPLPCWLLERDDSPWYPDVTLFRQTPGGTWAEVVEKITEKLSGL